MAAMLLLHEDPKEPLASQDRKAIESGNIGKILELIKESHGISSTATGHQSAAQKKAVINFFARVRANALFMSKVHAFLDDILKTYGESLKPGEKALVRLADAKLLADALKSENGGMEIGFPIRAWSC